MSTYFNDASSLTGFTERWDASSIFGTATYASDSCIRATISSAGNHLLSLDAVDSDGNRDNVDVLIKIASAAWTTGNYNGGIAVRVTDDSTTSEDGLYLSVYATTTTPTLRLRKLVNGTATTLTTSSGAQVTSSLASDTWYWLRYKVTSGNLHYAQMWADGESQSGWAIDGYSNSDVTGVGRVGFYASNATPDPYFGQIGVGTNGDDAPASASSGTTVTGVVGHLTLTGKTATVTQPRAITSVVGHLTLTGKTAAVTQAANQTVTGVVGHLTLTGKTATVTQTANQTVTGVVGHLTLTGKTNTVTQTANQTVAGVVGHLTLTGKTATVDQTVSGQITGVTGHLSLSGKTATVTQPRAIESVVGHLSLVGKTATVTQAANQTISGVVGHLTLGGYAPVLTQTANQTIGPITGHLTLSGKIPTVTEAAGNQTVTGVVGHLGLTGYVPTITSGSELGGRLIHRRRRYGVRNRIYEADPEELVEIAEAAEVPLEEIKEVVQGPERNRKGDGKPKHEDESGNLFWYPHEIWGRGAKGWEEKFTSPLGDDFFRTIELLKRAENRPKQPQQAIWQQNQQTLLLLLLT